MNRTARPRRARARLCLAVLSSLSFLASVSPSPAAASGPMLAWRLDRGSVPPEACGPPVGEVLLCGAWGDYQFARGELPASGCVPAADGKESPPAFVPSGWPDPPTEEWFPCRGGHCFATETVVEAWAAVVDWNDPHGWSVGQTLLQASNGRAAARLFPLDQPPSSVEQVLEDFAVGDAHLLAQLCTLAEQIETGPWGPPLVVNISAGRLAGAAGAGGLVPAHEEPTLASQILGLIDHLASSGIAFVAAAGHHRAELFPAHLPPVLAVGPVDLPNQRYTGQVVPSWQAADGLSALFPAHGLELYSPEMDCWPVPAGTSFASATAAGWIAAYRTLDGNWTVDDAAAAWSPAEVDGRYFLSRHGNALAETDLAGPAALVAGALGGSACGEGPGPPSAGVVLEVMAPASDPTLALPSLIELMDEIGPSPENEPCVPCDIPTAFGPGPEVVRLHASLPLVPFYRIADVYLLTGGTFHRLRSSGEEGVLEQLENGAVGTLELQGFHAVHLQPWHEALLVFHLVDGERGLWTSVPIDVLP